MKILAEKTEMQNTGELYGEVHSQIVQHEGAFYLRTMMDARLGDNWIPPGEEDPAFFSLVELDEEEANHTIAEWEAEV